MIQREAQRYKKRELELERVQFVKKGKRALQRKAKQTETDHESSDVDGDCPSTIVVDQLHLLLVQLSNSGLHHLPHHQCPQTARESRIST